MYYAAATTNFGINFKDNIFKDVCPGPGFMENGVSYPLSQGSSTR